MAMTMTQKILAAHAGLESVVAGQLINAKLDVVLGNDITTPVAINEFKNLDDIISYSFTKFFHNTLLGSAENNIVKKAIIRLIIILCIIYYLSIC